MRHLTDSVIKRLHQEAQMPRSPALRVAFHARGVRFLSESRYRGFPDLYEDLLSQRRLPFPDEENIAIVAWRYNNDFFYL